MRIRLVLVAFVGFGVAAASLVALGACDSDEPSARPLGGGDAGDAGPEACTQFEMPDGGPVRVTGVVLQALRDDAGPQSPVPGAMIAVEYAPSYTQWCDLSKASPYYVFGTVADEAGRFTLDAKEGALGLHSVAPGPLYG
ncbi:MAG: hypothetical protein ABW133_14770, partial [Polyangiaceae bacterium]